MNDSQRSLAILPLLVASTLGLLFEMIVVRWLSAEAGLFSYFKNPFLTASSRCPGSVFWLLRLTIPR